MAKLYWRVKINGKWTWVAATDDNTIIAAPSVSAAMMHPVNGWENFIKHPGVYEEE